MKKKYAFLLAFLITLMIFIDYTFINGNLSLTGKIISEDFSGYKKEYPAFHSGIQNARTFTIASWNLQVFGQKKASNQELMNTYASIISQYDIIFIQEIKDISGLAFQDLCNMLENYQCTNSSRAGRTPAKEQIGIIYRKGINLTDFFEFNPDKEDRWEYAPVKVKFDINNQNITVYNMHTTPSDVANEMKNLESAIINEGSTLVLGDFNADCYYYNRGASNNFANWHWIIKDHENTMVSNNGCADDRIILNENLLSKLNSYGIYEDKIDKNVSDHYLIWVEFRLDFILTLL